MTFRRNKIEFYKPEIEDLWFKETMLADEDTMSYNHAYGGTVPFPKEKWVAWYDRWLENHDGKRFYRYIQVNGIFVGETAYRFDEERQIYIADVIIHAPYRCNGYGKQALLMLCEAAKENGIETLYDDIAIDNPSVAMFFKCGFREVLRTEEYVLVKKEIF